MNIFEILSQNKRKYVTIDYPRYVDGKSIGKVVLRTLFADELKEIEKDVAIDVDDEFKGSSKVFSETSPILLQRFVDRESHYRACHTLSMAIVDPEDKEKRLFAIPKLVEQHCSLTEATALFKEWKLMHEELPLGPMEQDVFDAWMEKLDKSAREDQLSFLGEMPVDMLRRFTVYLVSRCSTLASVSSSLSSQLSDLQNPPPETAL